MRARPQQHRGFTLLELLLVLAILIILGAAAYPSIQGWFGDSRVKSAADDIRGAWAEARAHAIDEGVNYRFAIKDDSGRFKIAPDDTDHWDNADDSEDTTDVSPSGPISLRRTLPKGIKFKMTANSDGTMPQADAAGWTTLVTFLPDGTCKEDASIEIDGDNVRPIILRMRGLTGTSVTEAKKENR